jgi:hypothetical protein
MSIQVDVAELLNFSPAVACCASSSPPVAAAARQPTDAESSSEPAVEPPPPRISTLASRSSTPISTPPSVPISMPILLPTSAAAAAAIAPLANQQSTSPSRPVSPDGALAPTGLSAFPDRVNRLRLFS